MARKVNPDLTPQTYYLNRELDKDILDFISDKTKVRNKSELIRNAILREMRILNGEIAIIDIQNREIIGNISLSPTPLSATVDNKNIEVKNEKDSNIHMENTKNNDFEAPTQENINDFLSSLNLNVKQY